VGDDTIDHRIVGEEGDDAHFPLAFGTGQGINLVDFPYHLGPAPAGDPRVLLLNDDEWMLVGLPLPHFAPVSIGIQAEVTDGDLALVWNMGGHPGDKLQIIHALYLGGLFPIPVADLAFLFIGGEAFQRKQRTDHIFAHSLSLFSGLGPDLAVDVETCVAPPYDLLHQCL